jgi:DNA-binding winged helix-turn-helix (wHTH) protein
MTNLINSNRVRFGPYEADLHTREFWKFGTRVKLVGQPFEILAVFVSRPGELITRDELRERLWPQETFVDFNHGLNAAVNKLRDVLSDSAEDPKYIETLPRRGYRFIAKVERGAEPEPAPLPPVVPVVPEPASLPLVPPKAEPVAKPRTRRPLIWVGVAVAALLVVVCAVAFLFLHVTNFLESSAKENAETSLGSGSLTKGSQAVLATGGRNEGPQFSPDGTKLVFMSNRSGNGMDLWLSNADGSNPKQLTTIGSAGSPRWSPDGKHIAFDSRLNGHGVVLVTDVAGGQPRFVVTGGHDNIVPSWSVDGKYLYFASDRTGDYEVWKVPADGGQPFQITHEGGFAALESLDGKTLYYAKNNKPRPEIWSVPVNGGKEEWASPVIRPAMWAEWAITERGIFFIEEGPGTATLSAFDPRSQRLRQFTTLPKFPFWLGANRQGTKVAFDIRTDNDSDILEVEDFQ